MFRSCLTFSLLVAGTVAAAPPVQFNRDIRPILADTCFHCHGPDPGSRKASLRLDTEAGFFASRKLKDGSTGSPTIVKGSIEKSPLFQRLITTDEEDVMPPKKEHKDLKPAQIALIKAWIEQGAQWQPHWAFITPEKGQLPAVKNETWVKTPIDRFIAASLENKGLSPAPEADAHTLIRRVSLDLTGLPPSPELIAKYASHWSNEAYEKLIDELMKSERYGEHRARYWLDAARYGDTHGLHFDNYREMWPYRDWVIRSFNANQPFDKFTVEQIAGDLLPNPSDDQLIATGFQRCNITTNEGGTIDEENLANYAVDRVTTMGWVYMGLTTNCGQCHDHKFDPWTQKDFYSMAAFFRNTTQPAKDGNEKDGRSSVLVIPNEQDKPRWKTLPAEIASATKLREERRQSARGEFQQWVKSATPDSIDTDGPEEGLIVHAPLNEGVGNEVDNACKGPDKFKATGEITWTPGGKLGPAPVMKAGATFDLGDLGDFEKNQKFSYGAWIKPARNGQFGGIIAKMDEKGGYRGWDLWIQDRSIAVHIIDSWPDNALKVETQKPVLKIGQWQHVFVTYDGSAKPGGIKIYIDGVEQKKLKVDTNKLAANASIRTKTPLRIGQRSHTQVFDGGGVQDARVYTRVISQDEVKQITDIGPLRAILAAASGKRTPQQQAALYNHYLATRDEPYQKLDKVVDQLEAERDAIKTRSPITHIQEEVKGSKPMANILMRGAYDKPGEKVEGAVPAWLNPMPEGAPQNRLGLAKWLVDPANPLTARVTVNRFWQEVFGTGIVKSAEDFGIMGSPPSNQALLDWLAVEFRESGWDVRHMFKLMLTSAAYRQAAITTQEKIDKDRDNALVSRGPRFRMDGEMVRDYALAVSGTLSPKMYGPGTKPYQPEHIWDQVGIGNTRDYKQDTGENLYRRTVYNFWKRMSPSPNMEIFNAPSRESSCVRRERTNTPIQALVTLNDPQFVEAARNLAQKAIACGCNDDAKALDFVAQRVLCRPLRDKEKPVVQASLKDLRDFYKGHADDAKQLLTVGESKADAKLPPAELAAWTMLCNQVMNLDEVLNK